MRCRHWLWSVVVSAAVLQLEPSAAMHAPPHGRSAVEPFREKSIRESFPGHPALSGAHAETERRRTEIERWSVAGTAQAKEAFLKDSQKKLPGTMLIVATFFDRDFFQPDLSLINETWRAKTGTNPDEFPDNANAIDAYFKLHSGETVILIGHVEGDSFVLTDERGASRSALLLRTLEASAKLHNVVLIAVGCKTAGAGFPFGLSDRIDALGVERFLSELGMAPTYFDLLRSMSHMGPLALDLDRGLALMQTAPILQQHANEVAFEPGPAEPGMAGRPGMFVRADLSSARGNAIFSGSSPRWIFVWSVWTVLVLLRLVEYGSRDMASSGFVMKHRRLANHLGALLQLYTLSRWMRKAMTLAAVVGSSFAITYGMPPLLTLVSAAMVGIPTYQFVIKRSKE